MLRELFQTSDPASQPFVISGSGTLGWDMVAANLAERGEEVLVLHTGYFADSFSDCFETYDVKATQLKAPIGDRPQLPDIEKALKEKKYKLITITHVDTSTGVLSEVKAVSELVHRVSPETLVVVDGVCSVGSEEIQFDAWGIDVVLTASQKAIGCPPGLCIMMCSGRAIESFKGRKSPPASYYASMKNWLPGISTFHFHRTSLTDIWSSNAKLRSQEGILFCDSSGSTSARPPHDPNPNTLATPFRTIRRPSRHVPPHQENCRITGPRAIGLKAGKSSQRHDSHVSTRRRQSSRDSAESDEERRHLRRWSSQGDCGQVYQVWAYGCECDGPEERGYRKGAGGAQDKSGGRWLQAVDASDFLYLSYGINV